MTAKSLGGRPRLLTPELIDKAENYVKTYAKLGDVIPSRAGMARNLGIGKSTINLWSREQGTDPRFLACLEEMDAEQERALLQSGLLGKFNPTITKMILTQHGYSDRQEIHTTGEQTRVHKVQYEIVDPKDKE